jgi:ATP-dependent Lon protease
VRRAAGRLDRRRGAAIADELAGGHDRELVVDVIVRDKDVKKYLGSSKYRYGRLEEKDDVAIATGLVYTEFGGDIVSVEVVLMPGEKGSLTLTGQLGDVMKESARAALTYAATHAHNLGIPDDKLGSIEVHVHVPAGAIPKDGPSAGVAMATAIVSAMSGQAVRSDVAMTGEITLRGRVLPIGGVKEKVLGAHRAGIKHIILPQQNEGDLEDLPADVRDVLVFHAVSTLDDVFELTLVPKPQAASKPGILAPVR